MSVIWDFNEQGLQSFPSFLGLSTIFVVPPDVKLKQLRDVQYSVIGIGRVQSPLLRHKMAPQCLLCPVILGLQCVCASGHKFGSMHYSVCPGAIILTLHGDGLQRTQL